MISSMSLRREDVLDRAQRVVVEDGAVRGDAGLAQRGQRPVEPAPGGRTARVAVDDVALARLRHGRDDEDADRAFVGASRDGAHELAAEQRLVRDDEDRARVRHACTSSAVRSFAGLMTAWRAPGTPYSYGPPTTCGISSKLKIGGGEETCHSSV